MRGPDRLMSDLPIGDYGLISDCHSAALVSRWGSVDWLCFPRFDGSSVFARLLDADAGYWSIRPVGAYRSARRYVSDTMVLETTFTTASGSVRMIDAMAVGRNDRGHELGAGAPGAVLRSVVGVDGDVELEFVCAPRPDYGLASPVFEELDGGVRCRGGGVALTLSCPVPFRIDGAIVRAGVEVRQGDEIGFALHHRSIEQEPAAIWPTADIVKGLADTVDAWRSWAELHQSYDGPWRDLVHHSGRTLYALTYFPTGAIVPAPTTSLPETPGGSRNWDYRYTWVRDASFTMQALWVAACPDEADKFFEYLAGAATAQMKQGHDLQIMFGVGGEQDLTERELPHLRGWRASAPVRVGNGAWNQRQIDVYGELLDAAFVLRDQLDKLSPSTRRFLADLADTAAARWPDRDQGIWEIRGEPRHFVYSKLMCWVALDRAIALAGRPDAHDRVPAWIATRDEIADAILRYGWNERTGAFTQSFDSDELDASNLMMGIVGFLPADDPRILATIDATVAGLTDERGLVYRYRADDGLQGPEGTFLLCTFWLAQAQAMAGRATEARATFERALTFVNDLGLLAEEVDTNTGELLGNFPQAFSHIGLINAAWAISERERQNRT